MRTTLKRGIGQVGGQNGNGHSAAPPLFGPTVLYRQPGAPRRSVSGLILRAFGWLVLAAAVIGSGAAGGFYLYGHETLNSIQEKSPQLKHVSNLLPYAKPGQPAIALVAGYDVRGKSTGANPYAGSNSDTLMLLRADPRNNTLSLLSFPRDFYVPIYCNGATQYTTDRINSAWSHCSNGPAGTLDTMERLTHLQINYFITLDFHAFKQLVNQLHGVYINVDRRYYNPLHTGYSAINLQPGYQKLSGGAALSYVRFRHTDSDIYRTGRQQLFIEALKSRLRTSLSLSNFFYKLPGIIGVLKHNIEIASASGHKVGLGTLKSYLGLLYNLPPGHLIRNQIPLNAFHYFVTPGGADVEDAPASAVAAAVYRFTHPVVPPSASGNKKKTGPKKKVHKLPKSDISTLVLNAGTVAGEASNTSYLLATHGYTTKHLPASDQANAPKVTRDTTIYFDPVQPNAKQAAEQLAPLFGSHTQVVAMTPAIGGLAQRAGNPLTVVAVGTSFGGKLVIPHHVKLPTQPQQPAQVIPGAGATVPGLRHVYDEVHFPLMVPHEIAAGSVLSDSEGVRGFKPVGHQHEVVLTFNVAGTYKYWQIEESTWNSAPILQNPSYTFTKRGQKFQVYTTGGAVQMVALRTPRATYWVVNTILNELSNKTMLAIAESFRPLRR
ncbi:MAG TPA: LCP family protein [Gaiellaceae bacterium]|nr:LCP family protein [Gaiellaceae bacterium]